MAIPNELVKRKLQLRMSPHSVSIHFQPNTISLPASMPPLYLRVTRGSRSTESPQAILEEVVAGSMMYIATWPSCTLTLNVALNRHSVNGKFEAKEIKIQLKIYSEGRSSNKNLASCTYNINCLNLSALDFVAASSETRQISLNMGKSALAAIHSIVLEATFHYEYLADDFDISVEQSRSRESSPRPRSVSPQNPVTTSLLHDFGISTARPAALSHQDETPSPKDNKQDVQQFPHLEKEQHISLNNATDQTTFGQGELHQQSEDVPQKDGQRLSISIDRPPKVPKKKFQWLKKIKGKPRGGSQAEGGQSAESSEVSSSVVGDKQPGDLEVQVENGEQPSIPTVECRESYQAEFMHTKNDVQLSQSEARQPPPKPKRRANRTKVATHVVQSSNEQTEAQMQESNVSELPSSGKVENQGPPVPVYTSGQSGRELHDEHPASDDSADERVRSNSVPTIMRKLTQQQGEGISLLSTSHELSPKRKSGGKTARANPLPKRYRPHSHVQSPLLSPTVGNTKGLSKQLSGSAPVLSGPNLTTKQRCLSASHLADSAASTTRHSIGDLIKPTATTSHSSMQSQPKFLSKQPKENHFGILKVCLKAVDTASDSHSTKQSQADFTPLDNEDAIDQGLHCIFTTSGSSGRFVSSVQPLVPRRTIFWDDEEEMLFYAARSKQLFILCRKTTPHVTDAPQTVTSRQMSQVQEDKCIGVAVLDISTVAIRSSSSAVNICKHLAEMSCQDIKLSIQPKGSMLLQGCFYVLQPRFKVSCVGTLTIQNLSGLNCNPDEDLSCTIKVDNEFQNSTSPQRVEECNHDGWNDEPVDFKAYCALDCDIQIWAYSSEETEYWCGGCKIPLAMLLPDEDVNRHSLRQDDVALTPSKHVNKIITFPVEPKGEITLSFLLYPSLRSCSHIPLTGGSAEDESSLMTSPADLSTSPEAPQNNGSLGPDQASAMTISKRGSLRRTTVKQTGSFNLRVLKDYSEEPFILQQENTDLKKEVEFLREELRQTKAKLAESEFYREQTLLELKYLQEHPTHPQKSDKDPKSRKNAKPQQKRK